MHLVKIATETTRLNVLIVMTSTSKQLMSSARVRTRLFMSVSYKCDCYSQCGYVIMVQVLPDDHQVLFVLQRAPAIVRVVPVNGHVMHVAMLIDWKMLTQSLA